MIAITQYIVRILGLRFTKWTIYVHSSKKCTVANGGMVGTEKRNQNLIEILASVTPFACLNV